MKNTARVILISLLAGGLITVVLGCQQSAPAPAQKPAPTAAPTASPTAAPSAEPIKVTISHARAPTNVHSVFLQKWVELIEKDTGSKVKFTVYPAGSLYSTDKQAVEAVKMGTIQVAEPSSQDFEGYVPQFAVIVLPFLTFNTDAAGEILGGTEMPAMLQKLSEAKGFKIWISPTGDPITIYTKTKVSRLADLKGVKVIVPPSKINEDIMAKLGASGIGMATAERYTGLAQGMADAVFTSAQTMYSFKWYEVTKYALLNPFTLSAVVITMDLNFWNKLPPDIQASFNKASATIIKEAVADMQGRNDKYNKLLETEGKMTLLSWPTEDMTKARELTKPLYDQAEAKIGKDLLDKALAIAKKYEK